MSETQSGVHAIIEQAPKRHMVESFKGWWRKVRLFALGAVVIFLLAVGIKELRNASRREAAYQGARIIFRGLEDYCNDPSNRRSLPAVSGSRDQLQSWRRTLLEYSDAHRDDVSKQRSDNFVTAFNYGGNKCALFAIVNDDGDWLSAGIQGISDWETKRPLFANIHQDEFNWDDTVDARVATEKDQSDPAVKVYLASAVMYDSMNMEWIEDHRKPYGGPTRFVLVHRGPE